MQHDVLAICISQPLISQKCQFCSTDTDLWRVSALQLVGCRPAGDNDLGLQAHEQQPWNTLTGTPPR